MTEHIYGEYVLERSGGMPHRTILKFMCYEIIFVFFPQLVDNIYFV